MYALEHTSELRNVEVPDTSSQLSDKSMQSDDAVEDEYETFDPHLFVSRQLIVRRVSSAVGPPRGEGGWGSGNLRGGQPDFFLVLTRGGSGFPGPYKCRTGVCATQIRPIVTIRTRKDQLCIVL
jgi:hypothetical protein